jgi:hypothetical protein
MSVFDKILGGKKEYPVGEYKELDLSEYEEELLEEEPAEAYVRVAELTSLNELAEVRRQVYEGNIVIVDISLMKHDRLMMDRAIKELKRVAVDVRGDIAGLKEDHLIVTPTGIKIDRNKITGGEK